MQANGLGATFLAFATAIVCAGCVAPPTGMRAGVPQIASMVIETAFGPPELALRSAQGRRPEADMRAGTQGGAAVEAAARRALVDLRQDGGGVAARAASPLPAELLRRELDQLRRHIAAAWQFDADVADAAFMRVRLRATIAPDGTVRAIEFIDSHGESDDALARFVADAIATLDGSSPLPIAGPGLEARALVFRFEAGPARP